MLISTFYHASAGTIAGLGLLPCHQALNWGAGSGETDETVALYAAAGKLPVSGKLPQHYFRRPFGSLAYDLRTVTISFLPDLFTHNTPVCLHILSV